MGQSLDASVRNLVALYLARSLPVEQLVEGLPDGWDLDEEQDTAADDSTLRVMGLLAEFQRGDLSEPELRLALDPFAAWKIQTAIGSFSVQFSPDYEARVSLGADTEPQEMEVYSIHVRVVNTYFPAHLGKSRAPRRALAKCFGWVAPRCNTLGLFTRLSPEWLGQCRPPFL